MPPRSKDPLNFDDIFIAAGAEGLVKKSMGEMRKPRPDPAGSSTLAQPAGGGKGMAPPAPTSNPAPSHAASRPNGHAVQLPAGALDFLEGIGGAPAKQQHSTTQLHPHGHFDDPFSTFSSAPAMQQPKPAAATKSSDPFAMFDDVPGTSAPAAASVHDPLDFSDFHDATRPSAGGAAPGFHGFEDVAPDFPEPSPAAGQEVITTTPVTFNDSPPARVPPAAPAPPSTSHLASPPAQPTRDPSLSANPLLSTTSSASAAAARPVKPVGLADTGRSSMHREGSYEQVTATKENSRAGLYSSTQPSDAGAYGSSDTYGNSSSDVYSDGYSAYVAKKPAKAPAATGLMGALKGLGHKAVKAAQAGLQQLESALERMDQPQAAGAHQAGSEPANRLPDSSHPYSHSSYDSPASREQQHDDPGSLAADLLALPPAERYQALASIPMPMRQKVQRALDQLTEGEQDAYGKSAIHTTPVDLQTWDDRPSSTYSTPSNRPSAQGVPAVRQEPTFEDSPPQFTSPVTKPAVQQPSPAARSQAPVTAPVPAPAQHGDFLGMDTPKQAGSTAPARQASTAHQVDEDLLGMGGFTASGPAQPPTSSRGTSSAAAPAAVPSRQASAQPGAAPVGDVDDMHDFFSGGGPAAPASAPAASTSSSGAAARTSAPTRVTPPRSSRPAADLVDLAAVLGDGPDVDVAAHGHLYATEQGEEGEPELRRQLRAAREAEKHRKMKEALANKLAVEAEEARQRAQQVELKDQYKVAIESWKNKNKGNIRGLLGSLQTVLWEGSGWQPVSVGDMLDPPQIRKVWMRANLLVHPDKVKQKAGSPEQVARADMIFDVLKDAWNTFTTSGR